MFTFDSFRARLCWRFEIRHVPSVPECSRVPLRRRRNPLPGGRFSIVNNCVRGHAWECARRGGHSRESGRENIHGASTERPVDNTSSHRSNQDQRRFARAFAIRAGPVDGSEGKPTATSIAISPAVPPASKIPPPTPTNTNARSRLFLGRSSALRLLPLQKMKGN